MGKEINMLRKGLKSKDFNIKDLHQNIKRNKNKVNLSSTHSITHV